jgi:hypothetical protein
LKKVLCKCGGQKDYRAKMCRNCKNKNLYGIKNPNFKHGQAGLKRSKTYMIWAEMIQRCENPKNLSYENYGARGIFVCDEWHDFKKFLNDMGNKPDGKSIDRINNNYGYYKENCKWSSNTEQNSNKRIYKNKTSKYKGVYWSKKTQKWAVSITKDKKSHWGGYFNNEEDAKLKYQEIVDRLFTD